MLPCKSFNTARALFVPEEQVVNNLAMLMILMENYEQAYNYLMPIYILEGIVQIQFCITSFSY
ncbi:Uncharacterised protein [Serratia fonticola]|uniref:Uncharacterized protein n=1 Tax=Serratia fonticola TaxID=47917 RepID=A0A4U9TFU5_SERFO|nr:Uncharacterised protein [Serratia fonticola]